MKRLVFGGLGVMAAVMLSEPVMAQELSSSNIMDEVLDRFHSAASTWGPAIEAAASRLFWTLVVISMVCLPTLSFALHGPVATGSRKIGHYFPVPWEGERTAPARIRRGRPEIGL